MGFLEAMRQTLGIPAEEDPAAPKTTTLDMFRPPDVPIPERAPESVMPEGYVPYGGFTLPQVVDILTRATGKVVSVEDVVAHLEAGRLRLIPAPAGTSPFLRAIRESDVRLLAEGSGWWLVGKK